MCIRDQWWSSVAPAIGVDRDFPPWRPTLAQASSDVVRMRVELAELRECDQRHAAENAALRERNRLLSEEVAELRRLGVARARRRRCGLRGFWSTRRRARATPSRRHG